MLEERYAEVRSSTELLPLTLQILRFKMRRAQEIGIAGARRQLTSIEEQSYRGQRRRKSRPAGRRSVERLTAVVRKLGERCREIFRLKLLGRSFAEIQEDLGAASINTVYTWDARCRKKLLGMMGGRWDA